MFTVSALATDQDNVLVCHGTAVKVLAVKLEMTGAPVEAGFTVTDV